MPNVSRIGSTDRPLRVAIIGSGPAGFFAADALFKTPELEVEVDMFDRLPTPYGLVRAGVAPDHQKIKSVVRTYERTASHERFRFIGNARLGGSLHVGDLKQHYDQVIYAVGADTGRELDVPGRGALGFHPAAVIVGWYNGHPDFLRAKYDFSVKSVVIVGHGNVALDVSRIFAKSDTELRETDIAPHALDSLCRKKVKDIYVVGRSGPLQATFTPPELKEYGELEDAVVVVDPNDVAPTPEFEAELASATKAQQKNVEILRDYASQENHKNKDAAVRVHFIFNATTNEVLVDEAGRVTGVRFERTTTTTVDGRDVVTNVGSFYDIEAGMVIPAIGFTTSQIPGVAFDSQAHKISNDGGRVVVFETGDVVPNEYVVGWARTGPRGVIGVHKAASKEVVDLLLEDLANGTVENRQLPPRHVIVGTLEARGVATLSFDDWKSLDALEVMRGEMRGAPREKFSNVEEMLKAVGKDGV